VKVKKLSKILSVASQKGGVGKTTTTINLAGGLVQHHKKVLLIDMDPQCSIIFGVGLRKETILSGVYNIITDKQLAKNVIHLTSYNNLDLIPFGSFQTVDYKNVYSANNDNFHFINEIKNISSKYDYVLFDCPPGSGPLTKLALECSDSLIIPLQCEPLALKTLPQLLKLIRMIKNINPLLNLEGILMTQYERSSPVSKEVLQQVVNNFPPNTVIEIIIPYDDSFSLSFKTGKPITLEPITTSGAAAYKMLAEEIINSSIRKN
jgi:chromosome partitioning protein